MIDNIINEMAALTAEKLECLKIILDLKPRQKKAILEEDLDSIGDTIDLIQKQIDVIDELDRQYSSKLNELKSLANIDDVSQFNDMEYLSSKDLKDKLEQIKYLLQQIKVLDDENNLLIKEKFEEIKGKLRNLRQGRIMANSYLADYSSSTIFIDERN